MRQQFNLELYKQHPDWQVETRDGRVIHNLWPVKNATTMNEYKTEVCALIDGEEDALVFFEGGKYLPVQADSPFDLFLVTPEEELTEFELYLHDVIDAEIEKDSGLKEVAKELLNLAEKELASRYKVSSDLNGFTYGKGYEDGKAQALKEMFNSVFPIDIFPFNTPKTMTEFADRLQEYAVSSYNHGFDEGKKVALKDLPRWRKWENGACGNGQGIPIAIVKRGLNGYEPVDALGIQGEQYIMLSDLEKLPGFNE